MQLKKIAAILTSVVTAAGMIVFADDLLQYAKASAFRGDINLNHQIDVKDIRSLQNFLSKKSSFCRIPLPFNLKM